MPIRYTKEQQRQIEEARGDEQGTEFLVKLKFADAYIAKLERELRETIKKLKVAEWKDG